MTDLCERHFRNENGGGKEGRYFDRSVVKIGMQIFEHENDYSRDLLALCDECDDPEGNPVVTDPRFRKCLARLDALKLR